MTRDRRPLRSPRPARPLVGVLALALALTFQAPSAHAAEPGASQAAAAAPVSVSALMTNGRVDPLGIPGAAPSLSWSSESDARGVVQSAYQVRVATSEDSLGGADVWDSGKVTSDRQADVPYGGPALTSGTRYVWQVKVWDGADQASEWSEPATFETGLLDGSDWGDAAWIGADAGTELARWTDYTADFDFTIDNLVFAAYLRAPDLGNGYMWQLKVANGVPQFRPHRKVNGAFTLIESKDISSVISADELARGEHTMSVTFAGSTITTKLDGTVIDTRTDTTSGRGYVGLRSSQATEGTEKMTVHDVRVTAADGTTLLDTDFATQGNPFSAGTLVPGGLQIAGNTDALWVSPDTRMPLLRTDFDAAAGKTVARARIYATARGVYELGLNGDEVGDEHLAPGWTDYTKRFQHQTYDVTDLLRSGENSFTAELANGWWGGKVGMWGPGVYGRDLSLLARLRIDYTDGTSRWVDTGDGWRTRRGPYAFTDNIDGETYDARFEIAGWDQPGFDDAAWAPVTERPSATSKVVPQPDEPVRTTEEIAVRERTEPSPGAFVYDLGQNMVGVARMRLTGQAGDTVTIRYGEMLNPDGTLYTANLRAAKVTDRYTFATDGTITYEPTFTQHGFRYLEITGLDAAPATGDVTGVVWGSDLPATGTLKTSDPMLNQLASNISWGQRGNFLSIPTDTPARDERLGWTGDINVFAPTASYLRNTSPFLTKWMTDLTDSALPDGDLPGIAPVPPGIDLGSGLGWSDAMITVPYAVWLARGDTAIVRDNYAAMQRFFQFTVDGAGPDLIDTARGNWDDWLNLDDPTPTSVLGTAYFAENARMLSEMAKALGKDADAAEYAGLSGDIRAAFTDTLVQADGTVVGNSQTAYAMALGMNLVDDPALRDKVAARFVAKLASKNNHLSTGFLGTPWLLPALSSIGRDDLAYTLLMHKDYPSWGYEVENGATTMWERWDSIKPDGSFGDVGMNSFNHYAYGAVGDWMYQNIGAIKPIEAGYKVSRIEPNVGGGLTHGQGSFDSPYGTIATEWNLDGDDLTLAADVPVNTTAQVVLPAENGYAVLESGGLLSDADGVLDVVDDGDTVTITVGSGSYDFAVVGSNALLGAILEDIGMLRTHVADLTASGDLAAEDGDHVDGVLEKVHGDVSTALLAGVDGDDKAATAALESALASIRDLRAWLADSAVDAPVRGDLDASLAAIEAKLVRALTSAMGVTVTLPPISGPVLAGDTAVGTVEITNDGDVPLTGIDGTVEVEGIGSADVDSGPVAAGASAQLPVSIEVPAGQAPGGYDATLKLDYTAGDKDFTFTDTTPDWVNVTSGLEIGTPALALDGADPSEHATLTVPVRNAGTADVRVHAAVSLPDGWAAVPSRDTLVPAGESTDLTVAVVVPLDVVGGPVPVTVDLVRGADELASSEASVTLDLPTPPEATVLDHVDFGDAASEKAHGIMAAPSSGTNVEAGLTRRYAHSAYPGAWYSATVDVPAGQPFVLRNIETFDGARTKKYHVYVDDVQVRTQLVPRAASGAGTVTYDALIDDPAVLDNDGNVRIKFEYPTDAAGFFDPSIADLWVLGVPADTQAPDVSAVVASGRAGDNGWYRSGVTVAVRAADNRDAAPLVQVGDAGGAGWQAYVAPVAVTGEGRHALSYRATDASGNRSPVGELEVGIDATAPVTEIAVKRGGGAEAADRATVTLSASDALSGVATTRYRIDGGDWMTSDGAPIAVRGFGEHLVEFASTDVAGNAETMRQATITLADVDEVAPVLLPQITGAAMVGRTLSSTTGTWNTTGLGFTRQWLRNGSPIAGATRATYTPSAADVGKRISVRVTATKAGLAPGTAVSASTAPVAKATATVSVAVSRTQVKAGKKVTVRSTVKATGATATGKVRFLVDGKVVGTATLKGSKASTKVVVAKGRHRVTVRYLGSPSVAAATSAPATVRGT
ncbi:family 78 glycoside hydrolase catalytic domain [Nocardioides sp. GXZ039]|uniref:family 78 glycoside hydrolase catalytic domain n=1 Tax=Nocardioides sp. GXZ039 TaxID=3136018 RepID=UPI0030F3A98D